MNSARTPTLGEVINRSVQLLSQRLFAVRIGRIEKFDASKGLADVQPLQQEVRDDDGTDVVYTLAVVPNVPIFCLGGGDYADTYPVAQGDECLLLISDRSIDLWYDQGGVIDPVDLRRHNITDAIALVGLRSKGRALSEWPTDRREIGKQGSPRVALKDDAVHLGVDSGEDATELAAFASKTKDEISKLRDTVNSLVSAFNEHIHQLTSAGSPFSHTGVTQPIISPAESPASVGDVKCDKVFIK